MLVDENSPVDAYLSPDEVTTLDPMTGSQIGRREFQVDLDVADTIFGGDQSWWTLTPQDDHAKVTLYDTHWSLIDELTLDNDFHVDKPEDFESDDPEISGLSLSVGCGNVEIRAVCVATDESSKIIVLLDGNLEIAADVPGTITYAAWHGDILAVQAQTIDGNDRNTYFFDEDFQSVGAYKSNYWRVNDSEGLNAPYAIQTFEDYHSARQISWLNFRTGRTIDLGHATTYGDCAWTESQLACASDGGLQLWRYRD